MRGANNLPRRSNKRNRGHSRNHVGGAENGISQLQESPDGAEAPKHSTKSSFGGFGVRENSRLVEKKNYFLFCSFSRFVGGFQEKAEISYE